MTVAVRKQYDFLLNPSLWYVLGAQCIFTFQRRLAVAAQCLQMFSASRCGVVSDPSVVVTGRAFGV